MKGIQAFRGVKMPELRALLRECLSEYPVDDFEAHAANVRALWRGGFREERYLALDIAARKWRFLTPEALPLFEDETDAELLEKTVLAFSQETDFFIRKAIGWALREYSKTDPRRVKQFARNHADRMSTLSHREALRWLKRH